jgi:hypothetical protein
MVNSDVKRLWRVAKVEMCVVGVCAGIVAYNISLMAPVTSPSFKAVGGLITAVHAACVLVAGYLAHDKYKNTRNGTDALLPIAPHL